MWLSPSGFAICPLAHQIATFFATGAGLNTASLACRVAAVGTKENVVSSILRAVSFEGIQQSPSVCTLKQWSSSSPKCSSTCLWEDFCPSHSACNYTRSKNTYSCNKRIPKVQSSGLEGEAWYSKHQLGWEHVSGAKPSHSWHTQLHVSYPWMVLGKQILTLHRAWKGFLTVFYCTVDVSFGLCPHWAFYLC